MHSAIIGGFGTINAFVGEQQIHRHVAAGTCFRAINAERVGIWRVDRHLLAAATPWIAPNYWVYIANLSMYSIQTSHHHITHSRTKTQNVHFVIFQIFIKNHCRSQTRETSLTFNDCGQCVGAVDSHFCECTAQQIFTSNETVRIRASDWILDVFRCSIEIKLHTIHHEICSHIRSSKKGKIYAKWANINM